MITIFGLERFRTISFRMLLQFLFIKVTDEDVTNIIDEIRQRPYIKRGSMRLRRLRREDGDTPEGSPQEGENILRHLSGF